MKIIVFEIHRSTLSAVLLQGPIALIEPALRSFEPSEMTKRRRRAHGRCPAGHFVGRPPHSNQSCLPPFARQRDVRTRAVLGWTKAPPLLTSSAARVGPGTGGSVPVSPRRLSSWPSPVVLAQYDHHYLAPDAARLSRRTLPAELCGRQVGR